MKRFTSIFVAVVVLCLPLLAPVFVRAQQQEPPVYTFVALWNVPRAQWAEYTTWREKNAQPVLDRMFKDGTLVSWGNFETLVHQEDGYTHGVWWQASGIAGLERARLELIKLPPSPAMTGARHRDFLYRSLIHYTKAAGPTSGYLRVSSSQVQPGKGDEFRKLWEKYAKPTYDELLANGTITYYELEVEDVHTQNPGWRYVVSIAPSAEAVDKVNATFVALNQKRSAEEREGISAMFREVTVPGAHWDYVARIASYAQK